MNSDELKNRTKQFSHRCVKLAAALPDTYLGNHVRGQMIRCSTSVASNYRATCLAQSKVSFISKISIVLEETDESYFWLEFIVDENLLDRKLVKPLLEAGRGYLFLKSGHRVFPDRYHDGTDLLHSLDPCTNTLPSV